MAKPHDPLRLPRKRQNKRPFELGLGEGTKSACALVAAVLCPISPRISIRFDAAPHKIWPIHKLQVLIYARDFDCSRTPETSRAPETQRRGKNSKQTEQGNGQTVVDFLFLEHTSRIIDIPSPSFEESEAVVKFEAPML